MPGTVFTAVRQGRDYQNDQTAKVNSGLWGTGAHASTLCKTMDMPKLSNYSSTTSITVYVLVLLNQNPGEATEGLPHSLRKHMQQSKKKTF